MKRDFRFGFNNETFSDAIIRLESPGETDEVQVLHVSSLLLAAHSDYFMSLFQIGMKESASKVAVLHVTREERQGFCDLIEYIYVGELTKLDDIEHVIRLFILADRYSMDSFFDTLIEAFNKLSLTTEICLVVFDNAAAFQTNKKLHCVLEKCREFIGYEMMCIGNVQKKFLSLSLEGAKCVLESDSLMVGSEEEVFGYMLKWIEANCHDQESSVSALHELLVYVRLPWTTGDFLKDVASVHKLMQDAFCQEMVMDAILFRSFTTARQQKLLSSKTVGHSRYRPRNNTILSKFWGHMKTYVLDYNEDSCEIYVEFSVEVLMQTKKLVFSEFKLGPEDVFTFHLCINLLRGANGDYSEQPIFEVQLSCHCKSNSTSFSSAEYSLSFKQHYCEEFNRKASAVISLQHIGCSISTLCKISDVATIWNIKKNSGDVITRGPVILSLSLKLLPSCVKIEG